MIRIPEHWNGISPPLDSGAIKLVEFTATLMDSLGSITGVREITNTAFVGAPFDANARNDTAFAMVSIEKGVSVYDLALTKDVNPSVVIPGEMFTYSLQIQNNGPDVAK